MALSRRDFIRGVAASAVTPLALQAQDSGRLGASLFQHGVASGDPLADRVVLWTRVTPPATRSASGPIAVAWEIAADERMTTVLARGTAAAAPERDFTVKVDAGGLQPGRTYYYAFIAGGQRSPIGRTRTLRASGANHLRFAVVSCSNYPAGYFNAYRAVAAREDVDAVLHLGDYIYEFAEGVYGASSAIGRVPLAPGEAFTLTDYRGRYATYRSDPDLQEAHRQHPFIAVWDDHELANDAWSGGAANHDPVTQGPWESRRAAGYRAYLEWLPVREPAANDPRLYRSFSMGGLVDLVMLDTRGLRDRQSRTASELADAGRSLLGGAQEAWMFDELRASTRRGTTWRLLGQQVLFSPVTPPGVPPLSVDMWDGYPAARARVLDFLQQEAVPNLAILTGDLHSSWALDVPPDPWAASGVARRPLAVELVTPAISSPPLFADPALRARAPGLRAVAPHLRYLDGDGQGYLLLDITRERLQADWYFMATVRERTALEARGTRLVCERGSSRLTSA